jgi:hypothetical protein
VSLSNPNDSDIRKSVDLYRGRTGNIWTTSAIAKLIVFITSPTPHSSVIFECTGMLDATSNGNNAIDIGYFKRGRTCYIRGSAIAELTRIITSPTPCLVIAINSARVGKAFPNGSYIGSDGYLNRDVNVCVSSIAELAIIIRPPAPGGTIIFERTSMITTRSDRDAAHLPNIRVVIITIIAKAVCADSITIVIYIDAIYTPGCNIGA